MQIVEKLKQTINKSDNVEKVLNAFAEMCKSEIDGTFDEALLFEVFKNGQGNIVFSLNKQYAHPKLEDEYSVIFVQLECEFDGMVDFGKSTWFFKEDYDNYVEEFVKYVKNSEAYKLLLNNNLKIKNIKVDQTET